jgi:hypothetical protein
LRDQQGNFSHALKCVCLWHIPHLRTGATSYMDAKQFING